MNNRNNNQCIEKKNKISSFLAFIYAMAIIIFFTALTMTDVIASPIMTLNDALIIAYRNNPELQAEIDKANAMRGYFVQSGLYPNPDIGLMAENFGGSGSYSSYESAETTASITQPIPLGHRLSYQKKASYADYLASLSQIEVQKASIFIDVGSAYIDAYYAEKWHEVTKKLVLLNKKIVQSIEKRVKAGASAELDLRLAQMRLGDSKITENKARQQTLAQRARLARLLALDVIFTHTLIDKDFPEVNLDWTYLSKKIIDNPKIKQMHLQLNAKRERITAVKKSVWPDLNIQLGLRHFSDDGSNAAVMSANAIIPVFNKNQGNIMAAEAQFTQTAHEYQGARLNAKQMVYDIFLQAQQSHYEAELVTTTLLPLARKSIKLAQDGYKMGRYTYIELSTALTSLYLEEQHYQKAHAQYHKSDIQLAGLLNLYFKARKK